MEKKEAPSLDMLYVEKLPNMTATLKTPVTKKRSHFFELSL